MLSKTEFSTVHNNIMISRLGRHNESVCALTLVTYSVYLQVSIVIKVESNFPVTTDP